jgi:FkbM family methyltransferase
MKRVRLGDREVWALNASDATVLYRQIFEDQTYGRHGITVSEGDTVIDAGANIGIASMWFESAGAKVIAIEPNPACVEALRRNVAARVLDCALGSQAGRATLTWDPLVSSMGSLKGPAPMPVAAVAKDLGVPRVAVAGIELARRLTRRSAEVSVRTLAEIMSGVARVDLLKLDVEGSERAALAGIDDWSKVKQLIVETADASLADELRDRGYRVTVGREPGHAYAQLGLVNLYAAQGPGPG